jgi:hypothetical protein
MNDDLNKQMEKLIRATRVEERSRLLLSLAVVVKALNESGVQLCRHDGHNWWPLSQSDQATDLKYALDENWPAAE